MFYYPGIVVAPTAIINGTPLDCTICKKNTCTFMKDDEDFEEGSLDQTPPEKEQSAWWIKKYCTATSVDSFIMYFPFILLIMALMMVLIERGFIRFAYIYYIFLQYHLLSFSFQFLNSYLIIFRIFKAGMKLDALYTFLVKEGELPNKDVEVVENDKERFTVDIEDSRSTIEVSHSFTSSDNYFLSYVLRTVM